MARFVWTRALALAVVMPVLCADGALAGTCTLPAWGAATPIAIDRYGAAVTSCNGLLYVASGFSFSASAYTNDFRSWNPANNTWTPLATVPSPGEMASLVCDAAGNRLIMFGGIDAIAIGTSYNLARVYNIATNTWSAGPVMPQGLQQMASAVIGNLAYLAGGYIDGFVTPQTTHLEYNFTTNAYTPRAALPQGLGGAGGAASGGMFYVMGGRDATTVARNTNYEYNPGTNTWTPRAVIPTGVNVPSSAALSGQAQCNGDIILMGGGNPFLTQLVNPSAMPEDVRSAPETTGITQIYNRATNTWAAGPPLGTARSFMGAGQAADALVTVGGYNGTTTVTTADRIQGPPLPVGLGGFTIE